ncbi:MAG: hypothetical protein HYS73_00175 [Parcubacteria group bacterium]|nr:hypothetical protein [Parcubacteria group bacterium]
MAKVSLYIGGFIAFALFAGVTGFVLLNDSVAGKTGETAQAEKTEQPSDTGPLYEVAALWQSLENEVATSSEAAASSTDSDTGAEEKTAEIAPPPPKKSAPPPPKPAPVCSTAYAPVCGANGMTYKNECLAKTSGVVIDHTGTCAEPESAPHPPPTPAAPSPITEEPETPLSGAYPDFIVRALSHFGGVLFEGNQLSFSAVVKNQGTERAFERFRVGLYLDIGNNEVFEYSFTPQEVHPLEKGEETTLIWKNVWTQTPGTHTIGACADSEKIIQESLEKNNCETLEFTVLGKADNADLLISGIHVSPSSPAIGARVTFSADVKNTGSRVATSPKFKLIVDGVVSANNSTITPSEENSYDKDLDPGEEDFIAWTGNWIPKSAGSHTYQICADSNDAIAEVNEEDNCKEGTFIVSG